MESSKDPDPGSYALWTRVKDRFDLRKTYHHVKDVVKKHGWKIGTIAIIFEVIEHFVIPAVLIAMTGQPELAVTGVAPIGELIFYPVLFRYLGGSL